MTEPVPGGRQPATDWTASGGEPDVERRRFFRRLATELIQTSAGVLGVANALQQTTLAAASAILDPVGAATAQTSYQSIAGARPVEESAFPAAFRLDAERIVFVDQRRLPGRLVEVECRTAAEVTLAIRGSIIRGSLAIGQAAAYGLALTASRVSHMTPYQLRATIRGGARTLRGASGTSVALRWAVDRMLARLDSVAEEADGREVARVLLGEADAIRAETTRDLHRLAEHGLSTLPTVPDRELRLLTHSSTGALACGQRGTAVGIIRAIVERGRPVHVYVSETRPGLEGARLTAWELEQMGVAYTVVPDAASASLLASGMVDVVLVGAERIAPNGDTTSTIGTYPLAVLAAVHKVPFYVCALLNSVEPEPDTERVAAMGERAGADVTTIEGVRITPPQAVAWSPEFDVTPTECVSAMITEAGVLRPPLGLALASAAGSLA